MPFMMAGNRSNNIAPNQYVYDPLKFIDGIEIFTIAMVASFVTWKLLNSLYEHMYEPVINHIIPDSQCQRYYVRTGKYQIKVGFIYKEFVKWIFIIILLMIFHNLISMRH